MQLSLKKPGENSYKQICSGKSTLNHAVENLEEGWGCHIQNLTYALWFFCCLNCLLLPLIFLAPGPVHTNQDTFENAFLDGSAFRSHETSESALNSCNCCFKNNRILVEGTSFDGFFVACVIPTVSALYCFRLDSLTSSPT